MVPDRASERYPRNLWLVRPQPPEEEPEAFICVVEKWGLCPLIFLTTAQACCLNGRLPKGIHQRLGARSPTHPLAGLPPPRHAPTPHRHQPSARPGGFRSPLAPGPLPRQRHLATGAPPSSSPSLAAAATAGPPHLKPPWCRALRPAQAARSPSFPCQLLHPRLSPDTVPGLL